MPGWKSRISGGGGRGGQATRSALIRRYDAYLQILRANADVLELLSELEDVASTGIACGRRRFRAMITRLGVQLYAMAKMLRLLGGERYDALFPTIERIRLELESALTETVPATREGPWVLPLHDLGPTGPIEVGGKAWNLGRVIAALQVSVPDGFAVSVTGFRAFLWHNGLEESVRVLSDALDADEPLHLVETAERLQQEVLRGSLPADLEAALRSSAQALVSDHDRQDRLAVRSSASGEDGELSFAGQYTSVLDVAPDQIGAAYLRVLAGFFNPRAVLMRLRRGYGALELGMGAVVMRMIAPRAAGVAYSRDPVDPATDTAVVEAVAGSGSALVSGQSQPSTWRVNRHSGDVSRAGDTATSPLSRAQVGEVAGLALQVERVLAQPTDIEWALDGDGHLWLLQARPMTLLERRTDPHAIERPEWPVLLAAGVCAAPGVGVGTVTRVRDRDAALVLPRGSVMVATEALPDLALALPRAAAVVAERGSVAGHLAATAREFGVPTLLGADGATEALAEGALVTVDADARRVYEGRIEALEDRPAPAPQRPTGSLGQLASQVMPLILPLNLRDPESEAFAPEHCRTVHDVVRYIHEKALLETVGGGEAGGGGTWYRLAERLPFDLRLVPLEGGVEPREGSRKVTRDQVTSLPARALLDGLLDPAVKRTGPPPIDAGGFMSVVAHSAMETDLGGPTWAMVSDRYLQLSSRIGYHFATLEAFIGERESDGRIRFVFRGGAADDSRRVRRAHLIARVLEGLSFQVKVKGDFVSGVMGHAAEATLCAALTDLGRLLVCASRLDMLLANDTLVAWWADGFLRRDYARLLEGSVPPDPSSGT